MPKLNNPNQGGYPQDYPRGSNQQEGYGDNDKAEGYGQPGVTDLGENGSVKGLNFNDQKIQKSFIRKVYSILMCQLLITMAFITFFTYHKGSKLWFRDHSYMMFVALAVVLVCMIVMACCGDVRRRAPMNYICLGIFTLAESFLLGAVSSTRAPEAVLIAVGVTAAVCLMLTLYALQTKWDYTSMRGFLVCATAVLLLFGLVTMFVRKIIHHLIYASIGVLIFSMYIVYDTQLMMGGKHKYSISPEEYIFSVLNLYLDIITFMEYLDVINACRGKN